MPAIYQFYSMAHGRTLPRMAARLEGVPMQLVLDLEDSVGSQEGALATAEAKDRARWLLPQVVPAFLQKSPSVDRLLVRINDSQSGHMDADLAALNVLAEACSVQIGVMVPKVRDGACLRRVEERLSFHGGERFNIHPIVETPDGLRNLPGILDAMKTDDFCLSIGLLDLQYALGWFPLRPPNCPRLLTLLEPLRRALERRRFRVALGPILELRSGLNRETFEAWRSFLGFMPDLHSLSFEQTRMFARYSSEEVSEPSCFPEEPLALARCLVEAYEGNIKPGKNLVFYRQTRFISPHEYRLAVNFLRARAPLGDVLVKR